MTHRCLKPLLFALLLVVIQTAGAVAAQGRELGWFGAADAQAVSLLMSQSPAIVDRAGELQPGMQRWLALLAERAQLRVRARTTPAEQPLEQALRQTDTCSIAYARLPMRENQVRWLLEMRRDRMVFVARNDDPFRGGLPAFLEVASGHLGAPRGIYQIVLESRNIRHVTVDDQRLLAQMVASGQLRFGMLIGSALEMQEMKDMNIRIVAELPPQGYWFACSLAMPDAIAARLSTALAARDGGAAWQNAMAVTHTLVTPID